MRYNDLLIAALSYPDETGETALRTGFALARRLGGETALVCLRIDLPALRHRLANAVIHLDELTAEEERKSAAAAARIVARGSEIAREFEVPLNTAVLTARLYDEGPALCAAARTRDVCLMAVGPSVLASRNMAEAVLFGSGRPVLIYPEDRELAPASRFETVAIAWDGGPCAARAVAEAMPALRAAGQVRVLVATREKPSTTEGAAADLLRHLALHGVDAVLDETSAEGASIGGVLAAYVSANAVDLLVMGGFGHSRAREFVLGGATQSVFDAPPCAVFLSH